MFYALEEVRG